MKAEDFTPKFISRYRSLIYDTDECIIWPLSKDIDGYGYDKLYKDKKNRTVKAHRAAYAIFKGEVPDNLLICHSCDNPSCINPKHLWIGTCKQNLDDRDRKGRLNIAPSHSYNIKHSKLSTEDVKTIREKAANGIRQYILAKEYKMSKAHICLIVHNKIRINDNRSSRTPTQ